MNISQLILWTKGTELEPLPLISKHVDVFLHTVGVLQQIHDEDVESLDVSDTDIHTTNPTESNTLTCS
jgi:hypothetical protein